MYDFYHNFNRFLLLMGVFWVFAGCFTPCYARHGLSGNIQSAWNTENVSFVYTGGYMLMLSQEYQYYEGGIILLPASRSKTTINELGKYSREYLNSAYGIYGGYYFYFMPLFRSGVLVGTVIRDNIKLSSNDDRDYYLNSYSDFKMDYYLAFSIQVGMFSFLISNYGIGGGLCYMF